MQTDHYIGTRCTIGMRCDESPGHKHRLSQGIIWSSDDPNSQARPEGRSWIRLGIRREIPRTMGHFGHQAQRNQAGQKILHKIQRRKSDRARRSRGVGQLLQVRATRPLFHALARLATFRFNGIHMRRVGPTWRYDPVLVKTNADRRGRCRNQKGHAKKQKCSCQATKHTKQIAFDFVEARNFFTAVP